MCEGTSSKLILRWGFIFEMKKDYTYRGYLEESRFTLTDNIEWLSKKAPTFYNYAIKESFPLLLALLLDLTVCSLTGVWIRFWTFLLGAILGYSVAYFCLHKFKYLKWYRTLKHLKVNTEEVIVSETEAKRVLNLGEVIIWYTSDSLYEIMRIEKK